MLLLLLLLITVAEAQDKMINGSLEQCTLGCFRPRLLLVYRDFIGPYMYMPTNTVDGKHVAQMHIIFFSSVLYRNRWSIRWASTFPTQRLPEFRHISELQKFRHFLESCNNSDTKKGLLPRYRYSNKIAE